MNIIKLNRDVRKKLAALEGQDINDLSEWSQRERVLKRHAEGKELVGLKLPWSKTHDKVRLRPGEVSVWAGYNAHHKSAILCQVAAWAAQETKVAVMSFEMEMEDTVVTMAQQAAGTAEPSVRWVNDFCSWTKDRLYVYDRLDTVPADQVLSGVDYCGDDLGCGLIVIDSLMMCGVADDLDKERAFMHTMTALAKVYKTHIAIAHHLRKPPYGDEKNIPSKFDLRGSGGISDLAHTVFLCWKNKRKLELEEALEDGFKLGPEELKEWEKLADRPDQLLITAKQRHGRFEGKTGLWRHPSRQFCATADRRPMHLDIPRLAA